MRNFQANYSRKTFPQHLQNLQKDFICVKLREELKA